MQRLPIRFIIGLGVHRDSLEKLTFLGIEYLGALLSWRAEQLGAFLGPDATRLTPCLYGPWTTRVARYRAPETLSVRYRFEEPTSEPAQLTPLLAHLSARLAERLGERVASRLTLTAQAQGITFSATRLAKEPLGDAGRVARLAQLALRDSEAQALGVETLTLTLSGLTRVSVQGRLWPQREARQRAVQSVSERYPQALIAFKEVNPFVHARDAQFVRVRLSDHTVIEAEVPHETRHATRSGDNHEAHPEQPAVAGANRAG